MKVPIEWQPNPYGTTSSLGWKWAEDCRTVDFIFQIQDKPSICWKRLLATQLKGSWDTSSKTEMTAKPLAQKKKGQPSQNESRDYEGQNERQGSSTQTKIRLGTFLELFSSLDKQVYIANKE